MAQTVELVEELAREFDRVDSPAKMKIEGWVDEIVLDLLTENQGRFKDLSKMETIDINVTDTEYLLPRDFNAAMKTFIEVDSDGDYVGDCVVVAKKRIHRHRKEGKYTGHRLTYIKKKEVVGSTPGYYLVISDTPATAVTFEFDYYRKATANDINIIRKPTIIKMGVRGLAIEYNPKADYHEQIYISMKAGFRDETERFLTRLEMLPARRVARHNRKMIRYGGGG